MLAGGFGFPSQGQEQPQNTVGSHVAANQNVRASVSQRISAATPAEAWTGEARLEAPLDGDGLHGPTARPTGTPPTAAGPPSSALTTGDPRLIVPLQSLGPRSGQCPTRPSGPFLWRLFPRCVRASNEEVCIAAEVSLNVAPSECRVTAVKDGRPLPVRVDFVNDRQATQDDVDQPSRLGRGPGGLRSAPMAGTAALRRHQTASDMLRPFRCQRPDSELILIRLTPGLSPGLLLIELHAPGTSSAGGPSAFPSLPGQGAATTGALQSSWVSGLHTSGAIPPGSAANPGRSPAAEAAASASQQSASGSVVAEAARTPAVAAAAPPRGGGVTSPPTVHSALPLTASLHHLRVYNLSSPDARGGAAFMSPAGSGRGGRLRTVLGDESGERGMCSSGPLSVVVVTDAGMEAEVGELLALQHQQTPLPLPAGAAPGPQPQQSQLSSLSGMADAPAHPASGAGPSTSAPGQPTGPHPEAGAGGVFTGTLSAAAEAAGGEADEDCDDARARERFLWDLGAWLEMAAQHAAAREAGTVAVPPVVAMRESDQTQPRQPQQQQHHQQQQQRQQQQRMLWNLGSMSEIEPAAGSEATVAAAEIQAAISMSEAVAAYSRTEGSHRGRQQSPPLPQQTATASAGAVPAQEAHPVPRAALELLGFACSRGWPATSSHIVLGLMDMGHTMSGINAAVQAAHGWSALHLAVASGSSELVTMMALWRSYGRYGDVAAVQEEWRRMLAAPGPGGLTALHLAAVLPHPATAALDLLSSMPSETLSTWFGAAALDDCTPAHYALRAGNSHLNDHALLCLATGTAALDLVSEQRLQEAMPYVGDLQLYPNSVTASESVGTTIESQWAGGGGGGAAAAGGLNSSAAATWTSPPSNHGSVSTLGAWPAGDADHPQRSSVSLTQSHPQRSSVSLTQSHPQHAGAVGDIAASAAGGTASVGSNATPPTSVGTAISPNSSDMAAAAGTASFTAAATAPAAATVALVSASTGAAASDAVPRSSGSPNTGNGGPGPSRDTAPAPSPLASVSSRILARISLGRRSTSSGRGVPAATAVPSGSGGGGLCSSTLLASLTSLRAGSERRPRRSPTTVGSAVERSARSLTAASIAGDRPAAPSIAEAAPSERSVGGCSVASDVVLSRGLEPAIPPRASPRADVIDSTHQRSRAPGASGSSRLGCLHRLVCRTRFQCLGGGSRGSSSSSTSSVGRSNDGDGRTAAHGATPTEGAGDAAEAEAVAAASGLTQAAPPLPFPLEAAATAAARAATPPLELAPSAPAALAADAAAAALAPLQEAASPGAPERAPTSSQANPPRVHAESHLGQQHSPPAAQPLAETPPLPQTLLQGQSSLQSPPQRPPLQPSSEPSTHVEQLQPRTASAGSLAGRRTSAAAAPAGRARAPGLSWSPEPWMSPRRAWPEPSQVVAGLLDRVSPVESGAGSGQGQSGMPTVEAAGVGLPYSPFQLPRNFDQARYAAWRLVAAAARAVASEPAPTAEPLLLGALGGAESLGRWQEAAAGGQIRTARSAPSGDAARLLLGMTASMAELTAALREHSSAQRQAIQARLLRQMSLLRQAVPSSPPPPAPLLAAPLVAPPVSHLPQEAVTPVIQATPQVVGQPQSQSQPQSLQQAPLEAPEQRQQGPVQPQPSPSSPTPPAQPHLSTSVCALGPTAAAAEAATAAAAEAAGTVQAMRGSGAGPSASSSGVPLTPVSAVVGSYPTSRGVPAGPVEVAEGPRAERPGPSGLSGPPAARLREDAAGAGEAAVADVAAAEAEAASRAEVVTGRYGDSEAGGACKRDGLLAGLIARALPQGSAGWRRLWLRYHRQEVLLACAGLAVARIILLLPRVLGGGGGVLPGWSGALWSALVGLLWPLMSSTAIGAQSGFLQLLGLVLHAGLLVYTSRATEPWVTGVSGAGEGQQQLQQQQESNLGGSMPDDGQHQQAGSVGVGNGGGGALVAAAFLDLSIALLVGLLLRWDAARHRGARHGPAAGGAGAAAAAAAVRGAATPAVDAWDLRVGPVL